jgi:hypothetical protein
MNRLVLRGGNGGWGEMMGVTCLAAGNPLFAPDDQNNMMMLMLLGQVGNR